MECGYRQHQGGPFVRTRDGYHYDHTINQLVSARDGRVKQLPNRPDGMAYDDDPDDAGGRTCMGVIQRVYDAYRRRHGEPVQDVWLISDDEIRAIYRVQYWDAMRADSLPTGVDVHVWDMGVNAGIRMASKLLQRVVGVRDDGQIGEHTLAAVSEWDGAELIRAYSEMRRVYYRRCATFWKHGDGWFNRVDMTERVALSMIDNVIQSPIPTRPNGVTGWETTVTPSQYSAPGVERPASPSSSSEPDIERPANASNGVAVTTGVTGTTVIATEAARTAERLNTDSTWIDVVLALMQSPVLWTGVISIVAGVILWINRRDAWLWD